VHAEGGTEAEVALSEAEVALSEAEVALSEAEVALSEAEVALSEAEVALSEAEVALWKDELWKAEVALSTGAGTCGRGDTTEHGGNDEARRRQYA